MIEPVPAQWITDRFPRTRNEKKVTKKSGTHGARHGMDLWRCSETCAAVLKLSEDPEGTRSVYFCDGFSDDGHPIRHCIE